MLMKIVHNCNSVTDFACSIINMSMYPQEQQPDEPEEPDMWEETFKTHKDTKPFGKLLNISLLDFINFFKVNKCLLAFVIYWQFLDIIGQKKRKLDNCLNNNGPLCSLTLWLLGLMSYNVAKCPHSPSKTHHSTSFVQLWGILFVDPHCTNMVPTDRGKLKLLFSKHTYILWCGISPVICHVYVN